MGRPSRRPGARSAGRSGPSSWVKTKPWPSPRGFSTTNIERPRWASERSGSVRASSISTSARAAKVHQVLTPLISHPPSTGVAAVTMPATSEPKSGSVTATAARISAEASLGQPLLLLLLGAAVDQGPGQDLGPGDERAADAERAPAQLLGGDDHAHVVALPAGGEAVVLLGDREPEAAELGQAVDDLLGDVPVLAVDVLGVGPHLVLGEAVERLAHQLEVLAEVARALRWSARAASTAGSRWAARKPAAGGVPAGLDAPERLPAGHAARRGRPGRRPRRRRPCGPRRRRARRSRAWPAPWPRRRRRAPRRRRRPGSASMPPRSRTAAQAWSTRRWARSTASAASARSGTEGVVTVSDPNGSPKWPLSAGLWRFRDGGRSTVTSGGSTTGSSPGSTR